MDDFGWFWWRYANSNNFMANVLLENDVFFSGGIGEQRLYVVPHLELVIVITGRDISRQTVISAPYLFRDNVLLSVVN